MVVASPDYLSYLDFLRSELNRAYSVAMKARKKGMDPVDDVEVKIARDVASRVEGLVGPKGISAVIRKMEEEGMSREEIAFKLVEKIVRGEVIKGDKEKLIDLAVRAGVAVLTEGVLVAPTEGISKIKIKENMDGTKYLAIYFAGPIRSAGGTAAALSVALAETARKTAGLSNYRPTESEVERYVEEVNLYEARVTHLQYKPSDDDVRWIAKNCTVCIDGEPTDDVEVSVHRDLERVEGNRIRGGAVLVICEGIAQKAAKLYKIVKKFGIEWDWLQNLIKIKPKSENVEIKKDSTYLSGVVAGRPIFAYPMAKGGFRVRYGRSRTNGLMAKNIHPATMILLEDFIAVGTHVKVERPGKGAVLSGCDSLHPPIVRLKDGSVVKVKSVEEATLLNMDVDEILFLGDMLITYGDFLKSNHPLLPSGWCEEWWVEECKSKNISPQTFESVEEAFSFSKKHSIPLHPDYVFFWSDLEPKDFTVLIDYLSKGKVLSYEFVLPLEEGKKVLEDLGVEHRVKEGKVYIRLDDAKILAFTLGSTLEDGIKVSDDSKKKLSEKGFSALSEVAGVEIKPKAPIYIGARMGRPEKALERRMKGDVHVLFPTGALKERSILKIYSTLKAKEEKTVNLEVARFHCPNCGNISLYRKCELCMHPTIQQYKCLECGKYTQEKKHCRETVGFEKRAVPLVDLINSLKKEFGFLPEEIKGVKGLSNASRIPERLEKGFFRAKHGVYVFRDGTARFDSTDIPLTHFKPKEIGITVEKAKELGYSKDYLGNELVDEDQIVPLKPQDIVLSKRAGEYFVRVASFIDDILTNLYHLEPFYNVSKKEDLIGHLFVGLSPHTSSGVLCRLIGFTEANVGFGHPYFHTAKRRNADGDEDSVMLLLDALLNFSREYLGTARGSTMDSPLTLTTIIDPKEVDDEVHCMEVVKNYPLEFYRAAEKFTNPSEVSIKTVADILGSEEQYGELPITHHTSRIDEGPKRTAYVKLKSIPEKVKLQFRLHKKIRAVDEKDAAEKLILSHFIPDLYGNLRSFSRQTFRCVDCNEIYRRTPLIGKCFKCGGKILLTVNRGGIEKYLSISRELAETYNLPLYLKQRLELLKKEIENIFEDSKIKQTGLSDFM